MKNVPEKKRTINIVEDLAFTAVTGIYFFGIFWDLLGFFKRAPMKRSSMTSVNEALVKN